MNRELLQQALDALEPLSAYGRVGTRDVDQAALQQVCAALKQALAAPMPEPSDMVMVPREPTPEMLAAYLAANTQYWKEVDELPRTPTTKWRQGTPSDATRESYRAMIAAAPPATPAPVVTLQGGMDNNELLAAWQKKLPGRVPEGQELNAFAVGTEVGFEHAQRLECMDWDRVHHVLAKHGKHPGRTDDHLSDVIDKALSAAPVVREPQPEPFGWFYDITTSDKKRLGPIWQGGEKREHVEIVAADVEGKVFPLYAAPVVPDAQVNARVAVIAADHTAIQHDPGIVRDQAKSV